MRQPMASVNCVLMSLDMVVLRNVCERSVNTKSIRDIQLLPILRLGQSASICAGIKQTISI